MQFYPVASEVIASMKALRKSLIEPVACHKNLAGSGRKALCAEYSGGLHFLRDRAYLVLVCGSCAPPSARERRSYSMEWATYAAER
jgi:hypothetical protein